MNAVFRFPGLKWGVIFFVALAAPVCAEEAVDVTALKHWVEAQRSLRSLAGTFTQKKKIRTVRHPLVAEGRFWYQAPDQFRWQLDEPPRNIALHTGGQLTMVDVKKKRAVVIDLASGDQRSRFDNYFDLGFPRSWESFQQTFDVITLRMEATSLHAKLSPRSRLMAKSMKFVHLVIDAPTQRLLEFSLDLRDGSAITTTFKDVARNLEMTPSTFAVSLEGYKVRKSRKQE